MKRWHCTKIYTSWFTQPEKKQSSKNTRMLSVISLSAKSDLSTFTIPWRNKTNPSLTPSGQTIKFPHRYLTTQPPVITQSPRPSASSEWEKEASIKSRSISILAWTVWNSSKSSTDATTITFLSWLLWVLWARPRKALSIIWFRSSQSRNEWWKKACFSTSTSTEPMVATLYQWSDKSKWDKMFQWASMSETN